MTQRTQTRERKKKDLSLAIGNLAKVRQDGSWYTVAKIEELVGGRWVSRKTTKKRTHDILVWLRVAGSTRRICVSPKQISDVIR